MLKIFVTYVNKDLKHSFDEFIETQFETKSDLYKGLVKAYGRCTGKMFIDTNTDYGMKAKHIGWVFLKKEKYENSKDKFLQETWVALVNQKPEVIRHIDYQVAS
jgi:hypothetical protein